MELGPFSPLRMGTDQILSQLRQLLGETINNFSISRSLVVPLFQELPKTGNKLALFPGFTLVEFALK